MQIQTKHIISAFSLSLLLIPSVYGMEVDTKTGDFDYYFEKYKDQIAKKIKEMSSVEEHNLATLPVWKELGYREPGVWILKDLGVLHTARELFSDQEFLAAFQEAQKAAARANNLTAENRKQSLELFKKKISIFSGRPINILGIIGAICDFELAPLIEKSE